MWKTASVHVQTTIGNAIPFSFTIPLHASVNANLILRDCQLKNLVSARTTMIQPTGLALALAVEVDQVQHPEPEPQPQGLPMELALALTVEVDQVQHPEPEPQLQGLKVQVKRMTLQEDLGVLVNLTEVVQGELLEVQWEHLEVHEMKIVSVMSMILVEVAPLLAAVDQETQA